MAWDINKGLKVAKHFDKFAIVGNYWGEYFIVDVMESKIVYKGWSLGNLKYQAAALDSGAKKVEEFNTKWNSEYGTPIDMPQSLKKKQAKLIKQASEPAKPIGSHAPSITKVTDKGAYMIIETSDGKYGYLIPSTGESNLNLANKTYTQQTAKKKAKAHAAQQLSKFGVDPGSDAVDTLINLYETRVRDMYQQAYLEMAEKQAAFMERHALKEAEMLSKLEAGEITEAQLKSWRSAQAAMLSRNSQMVEALASDLAAADSKAMAMLNGYMMPAYAENFNYATFQIEGETGITTSFSLYNQHSVTAILKDPSMPLLPEVDGAADMAWCRRKVSSCVAQSILQGESVTSAAQRLAGVVGMGANSAVRAARTALTGAQNLGRLDAARRASEMGIELKKQWVATVDARTRYSHREIDRETVEIEEKFSNGCEFPGDPTAEGAEVWNCRCAMRFVLPGHEYDDVPSKTREGVDYEEWKNEKALKSQQVKDKLQAELDALEAEKGKLEALMPENKVYSGIWKDDVTLADYPSKIDSIPKKKEYYETVLDALDDPTSPYQQAKHAAALKHLDELDEFEELGKKYAEAKAAVSDQLEAIDERRKEIGTKLSKLQGRNDYSEERKAAAYKWTSKKDADDVLRPMTERAWAAATRDEQLAIWGYTSGSGKYNRPLSGFQGGWGEYYYKGVGKVDLDYEGAGKEIRDATAFISRSVTEEDFWVRRGCGLGCMDSFFEVGFGGVEKMTDEQLAGLVGHSNRIPGFLSCGTASETGAGFSGQVDMKIFVPKGTQATYAEPYSAYTGASYNGKNWDGKMKQSSIGWEDETIIQRGASYTCTKFEKRGSYSYYAEFEVHPEQGYDLFE